MVIKLHIGHRDKLHSYSGISMTMSARNVSTLLLSIALFLVFFHSCRDLGNDYTYDDVNGLQVRADVNSMFLTNKTTESVYYFAVEQVTFTLIDWIPSCEVNKSIQARATKEIPYSQVTGYKKGCQVVVVWWHCSGTMTYMPGTWRTLVCQTP